MSGPREERGFTIIELMVAMMIMLIITVPLVTAFVLGVTTTGRGAQDTTNSADAQLVSLYFETDVASAETIAVSGGCHPAGSTLVAQLQWQDGTDTYVVGYSTSANPDSGLATPVEKLVRHECVDPSGPVMADQQLSRSLQSAPELLCDGGTCPATGGTPRIVSVKLTQAGRTPSEPSFSFTMTATRKVTP